MNNINNKPIREKLLLGTAIALGASALGLLGCTVYTIAGQFDMLHR